MDYLKRIHVEGFKSIREASLTFGKINVLLGANASGKSNLISVFRMLNYLVGEGLQIFVAKSGYANSLLYYGSKRTPRMRISLSFECPEGENEYSIRLTEGAPDILFFAEESVEFQRRTGRVEIPPIPFPTLLGSGHRETLLHAKADQENILTARVIRNIMRRCQVFQFHDTSDDARIRKACGLDANQFLYKDAGNLAAFLYTLKEADNRSYQKIVSTIRLVTRQFSDFVLEPDLFNLGMIFLKWREPGNDHIFGPHQLPDGLLRFMALATLFLQPEKTLPNVIIVDEPELGLHPLAVELLASLIREVSHNRQVIVATQSPTLVDQFEPEDIIVVERSMSDGLNEYPTTFRRLKRPALESWIEEYTMGELWRKNVFGGRP